MGASQLHDYGRDQSNALARAANIVATWCRSARIGRVAIVESPLGATVPARVLAEVLAHHGIQASTHEFLAPRFDKGGKRYSIRQAAKAFCASLPDGSHPVLFPDEVITGTRFAKLYGELEKHLADRLVPLAFQTWDATRAKPVPTKAAERLHTILSRKRTRFQGLPTKFAFPAALQFPLDSGAPFCASSPFFWAESDMFAGKRKINLLFGLIHSFRTIVEQLRDPHSAMLNHLCGVWGRSTDGSTITGHEVFLREILPRCTRALDWTLIDTNARTAFGAEYQGTAPDLHDGGVRDRMTWLLAQIRHQIDGDPPISGPTEGWLVCHAVSDLFAFCSRPGSWVMPTNRDFCEYTLPFVPPFRELHDELVRLVVNDAMNQSSPLEASARAPA
jgi:hypothetical protein